MYAMSEIQGSVCTFLVALDVRDTGLLEEFAYTFQPVKLKMSTLTSLTFRRCFFPLMLI